MMVKVVEENFQDKEMTGYKKGLVKYGSFFYINYAEVNNGVVQIHYCRTIKSKLILPYKINW